MRSPLPWRGFRGVSRLEFLLFDGAGALLWSFSYAIPGYLFKNQLSQVATYSAQMGTLIVLGVIVGAGVVVTRKLLRWHRFVREFLLDRITPEELWREMLPGNRSLSWICKVVEDSFEDSLVISSAVRIDPLSTEAV